MSEDSAGIRLLKKGQKGFVAAIFSRFGIILLLFLIQLFFLFSIFKWFGDFLPHIYGGVIAFTVVMILYLFNCDMDPTVKNSWLIAILILPVFGSLLFIYTQKEIGHRTLKNRVNQLKSEAKGIIEENPEISERLKNEAKGVYNLSRYVKRSGTFPVYDNTEVKYFPIGEEKFKDIIDQLEKAEKFIFMEYFIIDEGLMWGKILEILARKVKEGVDVRVLYDGSCEFTTLAHDYPKRLHKLGIKCKMFAPLTPFVSTHYNYRDHRKILVVDGHTAFTGGINLADEYINHIVKHGHWKDVGVMVHGEGAKSFTAMFLEMWYLDEKSYDFKSFLPSCKDIKANGYVMPFGDCPLDTDKVGEKVYIDMLNRAEHYVHIMSPYLILDHEMEDALRFAAERGVDVRLILPGIPDKNIPYALALTHYKALISSGVKVFEYVPGFVHAKLFVCDGNEACVGTINLDYRSLYHHFECALYMYRTDCIKDIEKDYIETQEKCKRFSLQTVKNQKLSRKVLGVILKPVAPLL